MPDHSEPRDIPIQSTIRGVIVQSDILPPIIRKGDTVFFDVSQSPKKGEPAVILKGGDLAAVPKWESNECPNYRAFPVTSVYFGKRKRM